MILLFKNASQLYISDIFLAKPIGPIESNINPATTCRTAKVPLDILDQVSPAAATGPSPVSPTLPQGGLPQTPTGAIPAGGATPAGGAVPARSGEMEIALKALAQTVRTENKIAELSLGVK